MTAGIIPTVLGPGEGVFQGGTLIVLAQNQTGVDPLPIGRVGLFDVGLSFATAFEEGGEPGSSAFNTIVDTDEPTSFTGAGTFSNAGCQYVPAATVQDASIADGSDGRFAVRGIGYANYAGATVAGDSGQINEADNQLRQPLITGTTLSFGKIIAIAREASQTVHGESDVVKAWLDGWAGFGNGWR